MLPIFLVFCIVLCCVPPLLFLVGSMLLIFLVFCIVFLLVVFGLFCFDCHRLVSCVASVASVSGLSILDHLLQFPLMFIRKKNKYNRKLSL
jgi:hypothetical protein